MKLPATKGIVPRLLMADWRGERRDTNLALQPARKRQNSQILDVINLARIVQLVWRSSKTYIPAGGAPCNEHSYCCSPTRSCFKRHDRPVIGPSLMLSSTHSSHFCCRPLHRARCRRFPELQPNLSATEHPSATEWQLEGTSVGNERSISQGRITWKIGHHLHAASVSRLARLRKHLF